MGNLKDMRKIQMEYFPKKALFLNIKNSDFTQGCKKSV